MSAHTAGFADFNLSASRRPAIYFNLSLGFLIVIIAPVRAWGFGLPFFPNPWIAVLEWGLFVPACLAMAFVRYRRLDPSLTLNLTAGLIALAACVLQLDLVLWTQAGIPMPLEYCVLFIMGALLVSGLAMRTTALLAGLFFGLRVLTHHWVGVWDELAGFDLYFDLVALGITLLIAHTLRQENENAWALRGELKRLAFRDPLTGLANRRYLQDTAPGLFEKARDDGKPIALVTIDVDQFKGLNDTRGHVAGDEALVRVARILERASSGGLDIAARMGGDELMMVWFAVDAPGCAARCEAIVNAVKAANIPNPLASGGRLTVSIGGATGFPESAASFEHFGQLADRRLYRAKRRENGSAVDLAVMESPGRAETGGSLVSS